MIRYVPVRWGSRISVLSIWVLGCMGGVVLYCAVLSYRVLGWVGLRGGGMGAYSEIVD